MNIGRTLLPVMCLLMLPLLTHGRSEGLPDSTTRTIFAYGGELNETFLRYTMALTKKDHPKICFLPSATGDNANYINYWYELCSNLPMKPCVVRVFINSSTEPQNFEESLLGMDAIVVGGGNTLNMLAIWKAQGIDTVLRKAYDKGIILAGGSAGALCWFSKGLTDSRPQKLSIMDGLGFIQASNTSHFTSEKERRTMYERCILNHEMPAGYACDDNAGMLFGNGVLLKAVSLGKDDHVYYISVKDGKIDAQQLHAETIQ